MEQGFIDQLSACALLNLMFAALTVGSNTPDDERVPLNNIEKVQQETAIVV